MSADVQARTFTICQHRGIEILAVIGADAPYVVNHSLFEGESYQYVESARYAIDAAMIRAAELYRQAARGDYWI